MIGLQNVLKTTWKKHELFFLILLFNIGFFFVSYMNPIFNFPCKGDTNIYINVAKEMLNGAVLYRDVFDHKGPFIFFLYLIPNLIQNVNIGLFLIDMVLFNVIAYFNLKTIKINNTAFVGYVLITIECILLLCSYITASPELIALAIISYANYWIISEKYKKPSSADLIVAGILAGILFWTKYTLGVYIAVVFLFFIIKNFKWKNVLLPLAGFLIPTAFVFAYFLLNNAIGDLIYCYFTVNLGYKNTDNFVFTNSLICLLLSICAIFAFSIVKKKTEYAVLSLSYFVLTIPVFFVPGYTWGNLYTPFIAIVSLFSLFNFNKIKKVVFVICIVTSLLFGYMLYTSSTGNILAGQAYRQLDEIAEDVNESHGSIIVFQTEPVLPSGIDHIGYKYFFAPTLTYEQLPEMYEQIYKDVSEKKIDYIVALVGDNGKIMPLSHFRTSTEGELTTLKWVEKISNKIYENYQIYGKYYKFTVFSVKQGGIA